MFKPNTANVIKSAPPQARLIQLSYGLIANWKITTGKFAIGAFMLVEKN
jgi:hypothetical protein